MASPVGRISFMEIVNDGEGGQICHLLARMARLANAFNILGRNFFTLGH